MRRKQYRRAWLSRTSHQKLRIFAAENDMTICESIEKAKLIPKCKIQPTYQEIKKKKEKKFADDFKI